MIVVHPGEDLQAALDRANPGEIIQLAPGDYRAKAVISTGGVTLRGAGADRTRILWDDYAKKLDSRGVEYNTFRTWTVAVCADGVTMEDLAIVNDALHPEVKGQEVALTVYGDNFTMRRCRLTSTQDTLFLGPLPKDLIARYDGFLPDPLRRDMSCSQRFTDCLIEGTVDFIFGCGRAVFEDCEIRSLLDARGTGYVAAPAHAPEQTEGFLFRRCRFTAEEGMSGIYLARPTERDKTARFYEDPPVEGRVPWVKTAERCSDN